MKVTLKFRQNYHLMPSVGWMNDPNGAIWIEGQFHLFYQFHPYSSVWGPMHWGHACSLDGIKWQETAVALAPDQIYDQGGCFSGTSLHENGVTYLMYTGTAGSAGDAQPSRQVQCLAESTDLLRFNKSEKNPVIGGNNLDESINPLEFRDPKIFKREGHYFALIVSQTEEGTGQLILYKSVNLEDWHFFSILLEGTGEFGTMWECPDYFEIDGRDVLLFSPINMPRQAEKYTNYASSVYMVGKVDWETGKFYVSHYDEIDQGLDFYAPQTFATSEGYVLTAWMHMWERTNVTAELNHGWSGCMVLPRCLSIVGDQLIQTPLPAIYDYYHPLSIDLSSIDSDYSDSLEPQGIIRINGKAEISFKTIISNHSQEEICVTYEADKQQVTFSRAGLKQKIIGQENHQVSSRSYCMGTNKRKVITLEIFLDSSSVEIFINEGEGVMSSRIYPQESLCNLLIKK
nr:glycoside hydrolase family 32 protein [Vagococcus allomyrinae]